MASVPYSKRNFIYDGDGNFTTIDRPKPKKIVPFTKEQWDIFFLPVNYQFIQTLGNEVFENDSVLIPYCRFAIRFSQNLYEQGVSLQSTEKKMWDLIQLELQVIRCIARGLEVRGYPLHTNPQAIRFPDLDALVLGNYTTDPMDVVKFFLIKFYNNQCISIPAMCYFLKNRFNYDELMK